MGCVASKLEEEEVVAICRERKHQLKLAVERRCALADAHGKYSQSLYAVAAAIKLFVARHSSPSSSFLITYPPPCPSTPPTEDNQNVINNPMFLQQTPTESNHEAIACDSCGDASTTLSDSSEEEEEEEAREGVRQEQPSSYFYMQMPPPMPSPQREFGWDFFNPFDGMRPEVMNGYRRISEDEIRAVREQEGIPELEEEGEREEEENNPAMVEEDVHKELEEREVGPVNVAANEAATVNQDEQPKGLSVESPEKGRELLEALKDIEDYFIRAYDSGKEVSRMLEASRVNLLSNLEEIKENSTKLLQAAVSWNRSTSSKTSSCKSLVASSSKSSSAWTEFNNDLFDDFGGMDSGSHSSTLERLYAWEKKLYEQVKTGDNTRKIYERKCSKLRNQHSRGDELSRDKTRAGVKELYARILVAIESAKIISKNIRKLSEEELLPQVVELLKGLTQNWKIMLESHETQKKILYEVKSFACPTYGKFCNDSHRLATLQLEAELLNWCTCFAEYFAAQKAYVEALHSWLTKFLVPEVEFSSKRRSSSAPFRANGPPLLVICHDWLTSMENLPDKSVTFALKSFSKDVRALWNQQGEEQSQKRKVDSLAKELNRKTLAFQKIETRFLESKLAEVKSELDADHQNLYLVEKKDQLDMFRRKLEVEKEKHNNCMQKTQRITLNGLQTGFSAVFESLTEFSKASLRMYEGLLTSKENAKNAENPSYIEGSQVEENGSR